MSPQFTDDDIGKTVVNADDEEVGMVTDVEHGTAHVEPDPGVTDTIKAKLGWGGTDESAYPLQEESVARVTDDAIHLERDLGGPETQTSGTGDRVGTEETAATGMDTGTAGGASGTTDTQSGIGDEGQRSDEGLMGDDEGLMGDDSDDDLIGDSDSDRNRDQGLMGDDSDDDLIGDSDSDRNRDQGLMDDDDDDLIGDSDSDSDQGLLDDDDDDDLIGDSDGDTDTDRR